MKNLWKTEESVHLVIAEGRQAILLERLETPQKRFAWFCRWRIRALHAVASGKAILAFYEEKSVDR